jgi:hypothetical protein
MKFPILLFCASALAATASASPLCTASPGTWCEAAVGDAGAFPKTGQATVGTGALNSIIGYIGNGTAGSDLYSIVIQNTSQFSATFAAYTANGAIGESNAAIYLLIRKAVVSKLPTKAQHSPVLTVSPASTTSASSPMETRPNTPSAAMPFRFSPL